MLIKYPLDKHLDGFNVNDCANLCTQDAKIVCLNTHQLHNLILLDISRTYITILNVIPMKKLQALHASGSMLTNLVVDKISLVQTLEIENTRVLTISSAFLSALK